MMNSINKYDIDKKASAPSCCVSAIRRVFEEQTQIEKEGNKIKTWINTKNLLGGLQNIVILEPDQVIYSP